MYTSSYFFEVLKFMGEGLELRFPHKGGFFDRSFIIKALITALLGLGLFLFLHFREIRTDSLEIGSIAQRYIVADVSFSFPDDEATLILRQEALLDVGKTYMIDTNVIEKRKLELEEFIVYDQNWRKEVKLSTFEEMYKGIEKIYKVLQELRFADARTIQKLKEIGFDITGFQEIAPFDPAQGIYFPDKVAEYLEEEAFDREAFHRETIQYLISKKLSDRIWPLRVDVQMEKKIRKAIRQQIPAKYTEVKAGSVIIEKGERVTAHHLTMLAAKKKAIEAERNLYSVRAILASLIVTLLVLLIGYAFLRLLYTEILASNKKLFLLVSVFLLGLVVAKLVEFILLRANDSFVEVLHFPLLAPFVAIVVSYLVNPSIAIFLSAIFSVLLDIGLSVDRPDFMITNLFVSFFAILATKSFHRRAEIFSVCAKAWLSGAALITAFHLYQHQHLHLSLLADIGSIGIFMMLTAVLVVGLLPIFESCFKILTDITLMEYMDPNHELLRRLIVEAPGTYQHALIMGNIAETCARSIGANGLFCRVATLYHDIGKMGVAQYFTENQQSGISIHQLLTPIESAQVIISHVTEGVALGRKAHLPEQFLDIIREHHGTSLVYYFYAKQLEKMGGRRDLVNEKEFRYAGPRPKTKEAVILMIVDSVEAASRALDEINESTLTKLVDTIVQEKMEDGQFDESQLTFEELGKVKQSIIKNLLSIGHFRVKYPQRIKQEEEMQLDLGTA